jgi:hypothetical protein
MHEWLKDMCDVVQLHQVSVRKAAQEAKSGGGGMFQSIRSSIKIFRVGSGASNGGSAFGLAKMGAVVEDQIFDNFFEIGAHSH